MNKICKMCKEDKEKNSFSPKHSLCKSCNSKTANERILKRFGSFRNANLYRKYGIFQEDYDRMYEEQSGLCFICGRSRTLVVDHSHRTNKVRKLLCSGCNVGIGQFEHDLSLFDKAKEYILNE